MKLSLKAGTTSKTVNIFMQDSSSTTGAGLTGLVFNTSSLTAYYALQRAAATSITLATQTVTGAWSSGGFVEISSANMPGWYRFDIPDAALASGTFSSIHFKGATNLAPLPIEIELTAWDNQDAVHGGLSAIPNATAGASTGLLISGSNAGTTTLGALTVTGATTLTGATTYTGTVAYTNGITVAGGTNSDGITLTAASNGSGINSSGLGTGAGIKVTAGATGNGIQAIGGATSGSAIKATGTAGNAIALELAGQGSAAGISATGGATGSGFKIVGGGTSGAGIAITTTSGDGLSLLPTAGNGITATANGTSKHGIVATGGTAGTSDGVSCVAGTGGVDLRAAITGNVTGNLSGSVGSVTGAVGSVTGTVGSVTGAVGSVTGNVGGNVVGTVASVVGAVGSVTLVSAGAIGATSVSTAGQNAAADALLDRVMSAGVDSGGDNTTARTVRQALRTSRNKLAVVAGVATIYKEDDVTASYTAAITTTAGNPISAVDPT